MSDHVVEDDCNEPRTHPQATSGLSEDQKYSFRVQAITWSYVLQRYAFFVMQTYLTSVWGLSFTHAAGILNIWEGIRMILPSFLCFVADEFLGDFKMLVISSIANTVGMGLIAMSAAPVLANSSDKCKQYKSSECIGHTQQVLFYVGMAAVAVGLSGHSVSSLQQFHQQQNQTDVHSTRKRSKLWLMISFVVMLAPRVLAVALPEGNLWWLRFGLPAILSAAAMFFFLSGWRSYEKKERQKSQISTVFRVFTACAFHISQPNPKGAIKFYVPDDAITYTRTTDLRFLEKAAIDLNPQDQVKNRWKVCSAKEVEEAKIVVRLIPMWITFVMCGIVSSIGNTYFVEQSNHLNRKAGKWNVPLPLFLLFTDLIKFYVTTSAKVSFLAKKMIHGKDDPETLMDVATMAFSELRDGRDDPEALVGVTATMAFSVICCITAASVERRRLNVVRSHGLLDKSDEDIPMSAYWLLFQFSLLAFGDFDVVKHAAATFYRENAPESMVSSLQYFTEGVFGLSSISGVLSVHVVGRISERGGRLNWFQFTLNKSRLYNYYWVLAALSSLNLVIFFVLANVYYCRTLVAEEATVDTQGTVGASV